MLNIYMILTDKNFKSLPGVYIITCNINGKSYVGESMDIKTRMDRHSRGSKQALHKAILKHGIENFHVYVEYLSNFDKSLLMILEEELITRFKSIAPDGYNMATI